MRGSVKQFYDFADLDDNIIFILMQEMYSVFMQKFMLSMKVQRQFHGSIQRDALLLLYSRSFVAIIFIATVLQQAREGTCESQSASPELALISILTLFHCMQGRA